MIMIYFSSKNMSGKIDQVSFRFFYSVDFHFFSDFKVFLGW
jgi:hypothetical protein